MRGIPKSVTIYKKVGETPLAAMEKYRNEERISTDIPMAYAGRLDPMASGKLLVLIGDECKRQEKYHGLDKEYEFEILFNFESDSGDVLGLAEYAKHAKKEHLTMEALQSVLKKLVGTIELPYPVFSSKTVNGKPLFLWQLEGKIDEIEIPTKKSEIYIVRSIVLYEISKDALRKNIFEKINSIPEVTEESKKLGANFRRDEIRAQWDTVFQNTAQESFTVAKIRCIASSGTYMRTLAAHIAEQLGTSGLAYSIHRTKIGTYKKLFGNLGFWTKKY